MNYLAHAYLSNNQPNLILGNFIADHIRGNNYEQYSPEVIDGIKLHRKIDHFTDNHPDFKAAKRFFYDGFEKYSGILIDIYFDHFLAKNFQLYSNQSLNDFTNSVYNIYDGFKDEMPKSSYNFYNYVLQNDIYNAYASIEGIESVLFHLSHRIKHGVFLNESLYLFKRHELALLSGFNQFMQDIKIHLTEPNHGFYK